MNLYLNLLSFKMTNNTYKIKSIEISTDIEYIVDFPILTMIK